MRHLAANINGIRIIGMVSDYFGENADFFRRFLPALLPGKNFLRRRGAGNPVLRILIVHTEPQGGMIPDFPAVAADGGLVHSQAEK